MKTKAQKTIKLFILITVSLFSAAFTSSGFVELEGLLNGRSSARFTSRSKNVLTTLAKGTRGEILKSKRFNSGNYGVKIVVLEGKHKGKTFWVYHRRTNSSLKLYKAKPTHWDQRDNSLETNNPVQATNAETKEDVNSVQDAPGSSDLSNNQGQDDEGYSVSADQALESISQSNNIVSKADNKDRCEDCNDTATNTHDLQDQDSGEANLPLKQSGLTVPLACNHIMSSTGEVGPTGKSLMKYMSMNENYRDYTKKNSLGRFCPGFDNMTPDQKIHVWTYFWTVLANHESTCRHNVIHPVYAGGRRLNPMQGYGLWAAETSSKVRRSRGAACSDITTGDGQARCAVGTMLNTQLSKGHTASSFSGSYWGPVRRGDRQILPAMKKYKGCF